MKNDEIERKLQNASEILYKTIMKLCLDEEPSLLKYTSVEPSLLNKFDCTKGMEVEMKTTVALNAILIKDELFIDDFNLIVDKVIKYFNQEVIVCSLHSTNLGIKAHGYRVRTQRTYSKFILNLKPDIKATEKIIDIYKSNISILGTDAVAVCLYTI